MTLQTKLEELYTPFLSLTCDVSHYWRGKSKVPFVVWTETGEEESMYSDNRKSEQQLTGIVDFYTQKEFDPICDAIQSILDAEPVGYILSQVLYENETNLIHYQWRWWLSGKG